MRLVVVGCGARKREQAAPAIELYTGHLFEAHVQLARARFGEPDYVLSGLHGLVPAAKVIEPYDFQFAPAGGRPGAPRVYRLAWAKLVLGQFLALREPDELVALCGASYLFGWRDSLVAAGWCVRTPLLGLKFGQRQKKIAELISGG